MEQLLVNQQALTDAGINFTDLKVRIKKILNLAKSAVIQKVLS
jgi:hypothetical protein